MLLASEGAVALAQFASSAETGEGARDSRRVSVSTRSCQKLALVGIEVTMLGAEAVVVTDRAAGLPFSVV